jgi:two-component system, sensor histidine kinase and response regulator
MNNPCLRINSIIAHDLRDSLASISGISDILIHNWDDFGREEKREILEEIKETSDTTMRLLSDLLDWGKRISKMAEPEKKEFDASSVIHSVIEMVKTMVKRKDVVISNNSSDHLQVWGDENMFAAIIRNLMSNAIKSCLNGGIIEINAVLFETECRFSITDNGIGMTKTQIDQLFPDTNQTDEHSVSQGYNNGFGLILCRDFLAINDGDFWVESQEGQGTTVYFTFPLKNPVK